MSISFPTASQNQGVFSTYNEMCVLVIACRSPRLHLEKILIFSSSLLNHKQPIGWHWRAFQTRWMNSCRRKYEESKAIVCLSARVSEESIITIVSVGSLSQSIRRWRERAESDAINLRPQRRAQEGWSRIEPRILDSRVPQKASIRARTASSLISTDASLGCRECRRVDYSSFLPHSSARGGVHGHRGETCCRGLSEDRQSVNW